MSFLAILQQADLSILFFINQQLANPISDLIFKSLHYLTFVFWGLLILYFVYKKEKFIVLLMIIAIVISSIVASALKTAIARERPYQVLDVRQLVKEDDNRSFPSNHAQLSFVLATIVFSFYRKPGLILFLLSLIIGLGRIYVGVHYPSDVLGGAVIGILLAIAILKVSALYKRRISRNKV